MISYVELMSNSDLRGQEMQEVKEWQNRQGISWTFERNPGNEFQRIVFGVDIENRIILEIQALEDGEWPARRAPTDEEITAFFVIASAAMPDSKYIETFRRTAISVITDNQMRKNNLLSTLNSLKFR